MKPITLTKQQARRFLLAYQGLWPPSTLKGKPGILDYVRRVGCIQFDPLNIVGLNPELVLQSRIADFRPAMLQELLYQDRKLVDGFDKNMSIYSVDDWPYFRRRRNAARRWPDKSPEQVKAILPQVRQAIEERGPISSLDLDFGQAVNWAWAPTRLARAALESMYFWGELVIHHRVHTRRVYDFASRHIPADILSAPEPNENEEQFHDWYVARRLGSVGLLWKKSGDAWLGMRSIKSKERGAAFDRLQQRALLMEVRVEGLDTPLYLKREAQSLLETILSDGKHRASAAILAPLDNLIWDRRLIHELFDFHYRWEVYKPVSEREYGYYVLPVLYGDRFVARFEPGREKKTGALIVKNWWWETGIRHTKTMHAALSSCFKRFLSYLGTDTVRLDKTLATQKHLKWLTTLQT
jgi:uncharacterized protein YcaQ